MGFENVGTVWTPSELATYLASIQKPVWANKIVFHHTAIPSLEQRPNGFTAEHLRGLQHYYENPAPNKEAWSSGPHLFIDDDQCWGMCDFRQFGVHSIGFNQSGIGIEVLGNYDVESPHAGRGLACWKTAAAAGKVLLDWLGLPADQLHVKFHKEDGVAKKTCPGDKIDKHWVLDLLAQAGERKPVRRYKQRAIAV
jgi:hypothetical protein